MRMFDRLGQQVMRLDLTPKQRFHAVSSIDRLRGRGRDRHGAAAPQEVLDSGLEPAEFLAMYADRWRALDPEDFPFAHQIADEFASPRRHGAFPLGPRPAARGTPGAGRCLTQSATVRGTGSKHAPVRVPS